MKGPRYVDTNISNLVSNERSYLKHREKLLAIQSKKTFQKFDHMKVLRDNIKFRNNTFAFQEQQRLTSIQRENEILLTHLVKINGRKPSLRTIGSTQSPTSRSILANEIRHNTPRTHQSILRQRDRERIAHENQIILRKLQEKGSQISRQNQEEDFRKHQLAKARLRRVQVQEDRSVTIKNRNYSVIIAQKSNLSLSPRQQLLSGLRDASQIRDRLKLLQPHKKVNLTADNITLNPYAGSEDRLNTSEIPETYRSNQEKILNSSMAEAIKSPLQNDDSLRKDPHSQAYNDYRKAKLVPQGRPIYRNNSKYSTVIQGVADLHLNVNERKKFDSPYLGNIQNNRDSSSEESKRQASNQVSNLKFSRVKEPSSNNSALTSLKDKEREEKKYAIKIIEPETSKNSTSEKALSNSASNYHQGSIREDEKNAKTDNQSANLFSLTSATDGTQQQNTIQAQDSNLTNSKLALPAETQNKAGFEENKVGLEGNKENQESTKADGGKKDEATTQPTVTQNKQ